MDVGEMMSLHGLGGEHQVGDMHSVFPGDKFSMLIPSIVLLTETWMPKNPLPLCVVLLLRRTLSVEILKFPVHTGIIAHLKYEYWRVRNILLPRI